MIATCPCGRALRVDDRFAGLQVRCPFCQQVFPVPVAEPAPPTAPDREVNRTPPTSDPEPEVIDLVASEETDPTPRPVRPPLRSEFPDLEEKVGVDPEDIGRIRRGFRRKFSWRRPATWRIKPFLDAAAVVMLLVGAVTALVVGIIIATVPPTASTQPQRISLAQLLANGPGNNSHVIVTDFVPAQNYFYLYSKSKYEIVTPQEAEKRQWTEVWVPLVPLTPELTARLLQGGNNPIDLQTENIRAIVRLSDIHDKASFERWYENTVEFQGSVVRSSFGGVPAELKKAYPRADFSTCLIIHEGRTPPTWAGIIIASSVGGVALVIGLSWFLFRLVCRDR